jgi:hypothetical protein
MATVQLSYGRGETLDGPAANAITEATGGAAPSETVALNIADGTAKQDVLIALRLFRDKIIQSQNLP